MRSLSYQLIISVNVATGQRIKDTKNIISKIRTKRKIIMSAPIVNVLINIPIAMEKTTKPFLYSFFQGLKKVFIRSGRDKSERRD